MLHAKTYAAAFLSMALFAGAGFAQEMPVRKYYRLDYVLKEVEAGKVLNSRTFATTVTAEPSSPASIRMGGKVTISASPGSTQFQYLEVGVSIDSKDIREIQNELQLNVQADVSTVVPPAESSPQPVIRQNRWSATVIVPLRKPTMLFASDDLNTKHQMQLELTATPIPPPK